MARIAITLPLVLLVLVEIFYPLVATATATKHRRLPSDYDKGEAHGRR
jgi:hypothetical protein